ncbi:dolichyl-diphosphooligosaccharide--protein glycosyltransferase subunit STT3B-like, partial [Labeo rohita]|uniref:dolichyl-diphosphooligosaccharide--protein glycosyltransferase subunit STT3B-like n=1 Tax=Labeo rohita TaxID=84645 RepID=UPI0021E302EC
NGRNTLQPCHECWRCIVCPPEGTLHRPCWQHSCITRHTSCNLLIQPESGRENQLSASEIIGEVCSWFNYRSTHHLTTNGFYEFLNWFDERAWYPLGRIVGGTVYPGLMVTAGLIHYILNLVHLTVHIRDVCVFLAPVFSALTAIATFLLTRELWNQGAGLLSACFMAVVPGYISRSVAGSFDNEAIAIFALQFTYFLWVKSIKTGSVFWTVGCCLAYFYMYMQQ